MSESDKRNLRLGVRVTGGKQWIAGFHYLRNLFIALQNAGADIDLILYAAHETDPTELHVFSEFAKEIIEYAEFKKDKVARFLKQQNLDCVFATADYGADLGIPHLSWLFDFQHREMPELFPDRHLQIREEMFQTVLERANLVILSSHHAEKVCRKYYGDYAYKLRVMPFVAHLPDGLWQSDPIAIRAKYNLPERFLYLPNQFWKHKNHDLVIEAIRLAVAHEPALTVVFSGAPDDSRDRFYGPYLRSKIQFYELTRNIKILGLISEEDVFSLMRASLCILQPSLYEGWSTVVEQAKSMGKPILLSDLEVHREQNPDSAQYFQPDNAHELSQLLVSIFRSAKPGPDRTAEMKASNEVLERSVCFGKTFCSIVQETIAEFHRQQPAPLKEPVTA